MPVYLTSKLIFRIFNNFPYHLKEKQRKHQRKISAQRRFLQLKRLADQMWKNIRYDKNILSETLNLNHDVTYEGKGLFRFILL